MSYLARLKAEISEKGLPNELTKPTKAPSVSFVSSPSRSIPAVGKGEANAEPRPDTPPNDPLPDPAAEARRQRVLTMLTDHPGARYAVLSDVHSEPGAVLLTMAIRGLATFELRIPREKYDGILLLDLIERHGGTIH